MDNPSTESSTPLNIDGAASAFAALLDPSQEDRREEEGAAAEPEAQANEDAEPVAETDDQPDDGSDDVTIEVDGKTVKLTKEELAEAYKNGLRQSDYTKKTMEVAEQRRAAEAEVAQARAEREAYAVNLQKMSAQLEGALEEQASINWQELLEADPVEYLRQQNLFQQRQAAYQRTQQAQMQLMEIAKAEQAQLRQQALVQQQDALLAKLPEWRNAETAKAEKTAIAKYLQDAGFDDESIQTISDHRMVITARKAMLYDQMMGKAQAATKKVAAAPQRVVQPGSGTQNRVDGRSSAMQRLGKSGRVEDAAAVFASIL